MKKLLVIIAVTMMISVLSSSVMLKDLRSHDYAAAVNRGGD